MMYEGTRDIVRAFMRMCFDPEETVKAKVKQKALPGYLPAFEKVSIRNGQLIELILIN